MSIKDYCIIKRIVCPAIFLLITAGPIFADPNDLNFDGIFEVALDLPRIYFLLKEDANGPPLEYEGNFELNWAFLDTGASGILLSKETADMLGFDIDPNGEYMDVGIGGIEAFDVSEPLYIGTDTFDDPDSYNPDNYLLSGKWQFQVRRFYAGEWPDEPIDLVGMPAMAGKTVVFYPGRTNELEYFVAEIKEPNDPNIPPVDFNVPLRFEKYISPNDPINTPPLPVLAYNPVIDNVKLQYNGNTATATLVLDTGGTVSLISSAKACALGLTDANGTPIVEPDFTIPIGGIGGEAELPGFQIDNLVIPTLNGYNLVYNNARLCVSDIEIIDEDTGEFIILDGIFGSNFLCASATLDFDLAATPFDRIVLDTRKGLLGFDVNDQYPLPQPYQSYCGDSNHPWPNGDINRDCSVDFEDIQILAEEWLDECNPLNWNCRQADYNLDSLANFTDYAGLLNN
jgi:hypothetical protein